MDDGLVIAAERLLWQTTTDVKVGYGTWMCAGHPHKEGRVGTGRRARLFDDHGWFSFDNDRWIGTGGPTACRATNWQSTDCFLSLSKSVCYRASKAAMELAHPLRP